MSGGADSPESFPLIVDPSLMETGRLLPEGLTVAGRSGLVSGTLTAETGRCSSSLED